MIKKTLIIVMSAFLLPMALFGANNPPKEVIIAPMTNAEMIAAFNKMNAEMVEDLKNPDAVNSVYWRNASLVKMWLKDYRFIEVDTEIDKSWYERAAKFLEYMDECKSFLSRFVRKAEKDKSEKYQKVLANLKEAHRRFAELVKNPTPVEHSKLERLRAEKVKWEAQHRREKP